MDKIVQKQHILVAGDNKTAWSICVCILQAGHCVTLFSESKVDALKNINQHVIDLNKIDGRTITIENLNMVSTIPCSVAFNMAIAITNENLFDKRSIILELENNIADDILIAINTESIALSALQQQARFPERLIGANWAEPVHTTYFLEIITNSVTNMQPVDGFYDTAKRSWQKDPYILKSDTGIRSKMMAALIREAFYLIENDYVTVEDVDRACRNDAGYYLPFAGNFRYMDLMGTYMYGIVMQELNPELSKNTHIPAFCQELITQGAKGMQTGKGFYNYASGEAEEWDAVFRTFSYQIKKIISKYPFQHKQETKPISPAVLP